MKKENDVVFDDQVTPFLVVKYSFLRPETKALPAVILGLIARIDEVKGRRITLPGSMLRVKLKDPSEKGLKEALLKKVTRILGSLEILLADAGIKLKDVHEAKVPRYLVRLAKNFTARRNFITYAQG